MGCVNKYSGRTYFTKPLPVVMQGEVRACGAGVNVRTRGPGLNKGASTVGDWRSLDRHDLACWQELSLLWLDRAGQNATATILRPTRKAR